MRLWLTPLCPAGHLPHKEGDWLGACSPFLSAMFKMTDSHPRVDLPTCGGDARQGRGGSHIPKPQILFEINHIKNPVKFQNFFAHTRKTQLTIPPPLSAGVSRDIRRKRCGQGLVFGRNQPCPPDAARRPKRRNRSRFGTRAGGLNDDRAKPGPRTAWSSPNLHRRVRLPAGGGHSKLE